MEIDLESLKRVLLELKDEARNMRRDAIKKRLAPKEAPPAEEPEMAEAEEKEEMAEPAAEEMAEGEKPEDELDEDTKRVLSKFNL